MNHVLSNISVHEIMCSGVILFFGIRICSYNIFNLRSSSGAYVVHAPGGSDHHGHAPLGSDHYQILVLQYCAWPVWSARVDALMHTAHVSYT